MSQRHDRTTSATRPNTALPPLAPPPRAYLMHLRRGLAYGTGTAFTGLLAYWIQQRI
ncbi:hypothetical protein [Streptomyces collinus]|uniref:hypothetical protein n=1 Tax=Streptomyces collinus TaxID=42684 RepID=UPI000415BB03|nr:hypothetical protein [Streptomyces collinus]